MAKARTNKTGILAGFCVVPTKISLERDTLILIAKFFLQTLGKIKEFLL